MNEHNPKQNPRDLERQARESRDLAEANSLLNQACELWRERADDDHLAQAGVMRCLRRLDADSETLRAEVERALVRFETSEMVRSEAVFVLSKEAVRLSKAGVLETAAHSLSDALHCLGSTPQAAYGANSVLAALRAFRNALTDRDTHLADSAPALETLFMALRNHGRKFLCVADDKPDSGGQGRRPAPAPRLQAAYILRKLVRQAEDWRLLNELMSAVLELGCDDPYVVDSRAEALVGLGNNEEAVSMLTDALKRRPDSDVLIRRLAAVRAGEGRDDLAAQILEPAALAASAPWIWRDLANLQLRTGGREAARESLLCALSLHQPREAGMVWRLHFSLAELAFGMGETSLSAREVFLAREARESAGWGCGTELDEFIRKNGNWLSAELNQYAGQDRGTVRREALREYRQVHGKRMQRSAKPTEVIALHGAVAFLRNPEEGPNVFVPPGLAKRLKLKVGDSVNVVTARSFDTKKKREGVRAAWIEKQEEKSMGQASLGSDWKSGDPARVSI